MKLVHTASLTDVGVHRQSNQDACTILPEIGLLAVADGMGGLEKGEVASRAAISLLHDAKRAISEIVAQVDRSPSVKNRLSLGGAMEQIAELGSTRVQQATEGANSGTTLVLGVVAGGHLIVSNVGDSRAYLLRSGTLRLLTDDHTVAAAQLRAGVMTPEEYATSPYQHMLYQALGIRSELDPDLFDEPLADGDVVLLCSDGLSGPVSDAEIARILRETPDPDEAAQALVDAANQRGGPDNISVTIARIDDPELPPAELLEEDRERLANGRISLPLNEYDLRLLRHYLDWRPLSRGEEVDLGLGLHLVLRGSVSEEGVLRGPGEVAGTAAWIRGSDPELAICEQDGSALLLSYEALEQLERRRPRSAARFYRGLLGAAFNGGGPLPR
ncbi:MAG: protein phosphatase 2C domain-containing protein [Myxococcota bacterium]|nr:protein phosphatase 2C domain-containing protein [Myxococcota bacterium]